ncbi:ABC transporter substrate-binding protein [Flavobacterium zepuense]|uniref:ABC transporter substrate-binding protein n=1 Tax=Flavobacterium zepuense TaxID=2593302 RepID=A0A552VAL8_9FLAO|nr:ABC transporter substrate-binding protein [Flavobacterium zepuense]TRW27489.1 ABC transporter substrate-binding protein [Flavobacterium zepuense]
MRKLYFILFIALLAVAGCKNDPQAPQAKAQPVLNAVKHAKGLQIFKYDGITVVKVTEPWPDAKQSFTYVMQQKGAVVPDSLKQFTIIPVPLTSVIVTSTTHIPSLEMLGVESTLVGFPGTEYISSEKTRVLIDSGKVKEAGANESLNTEIVIDINPGAVVAFGINSTNKTLTALEQSRLKVLYNGDWTEQSPLGKAEWIKFFGALYAKDAEADKLFSQIEKDYNDALALTKSVTKKPTAMAGAIYQDQWFMPQGGSWGSLFLKDAGANYLWADAVGIGSLSLSLETVLDKAQNADIWIGPSQFTSLKEMTDANPHYAQFKSFKNKEVYSYSVKKGKTGGLIYFEMAPNRPDLVLKDLIYIFHPELLPGYQLNYFQKLQ